MLEDWIGVKQACDLIWFGMFVQHVTPPATVGGIKKFGLLGLGQGREIRLVTLRRTSPYGCPFRQPAYDDNPTQQKARTGRAMGVTGHGEKMDKLFLWACQ